MEKFDITIVGSGIGGLICGCFLAKSGLKVLIIEQHDKVGGCVTSCNIKDCEFDMGAHLFGSCNETGIFGQCLSRLGIDFDFFRLSPTDRFVFKDDVIDVPTNVADYVKLLKNKFPQENKNIDRFFSDIKRIGKKYGQKDIMDEYDNISYQEYLDKCFKSQKLKGILSAQYMYVGVKPKNASFLFMATLLYSYLIDGVFYPKGGTQALVNAINSKFNNYGGTTLLGKEVVKIISNADDAKVYGVKLSEGTSIQSDIVICNSDVESVFENLLEDSDLVKDYKIILKSLTKSSPLFLLYFALKDICFQPADYRGWYFNSYDINSESASPIYIFTSTYFDKTLAPEGVHIFESLMMCPYDHNVVVDWDMLKNDLQRNLLSKVKKILGFNDEQLYYVGSATPKTFERFTKNSGGSVYGWEMSPSQVGERRLPQETPFDNLFLVGHWTVPGCGVPTAAVSGWKLANKVIDRVKVATENL